MHPRDLSRRDFHRLAAAAFGGIVAGSVGCAEKEPPKPAAGGKPAPAAGGAEVPAVAKVEPHACRGLNSCRSDKNACAGQSACATVKAEAGQNSCKNLGGCGENPGANACKEMGGCEVPMNPAHGAWEKARKTFEARMKAEGKKFGDAPPLADAKKPPEKESDEKPKEEKPESDKKES